MKKLAACLLLAVVIGSVYYNALGNGFVFDDYLLVVNRSAIPRVASRPWLAFSPAALGYRPLRTLSYVLDYRVGGMRPWIFHLNNLVYHWIAACLVFFVTLRLVAEEKVVSSRLSVVSPSDSGLQTPDSALRTALFAALLWSVHPIQTDAVTYISGRRDILSGLFFFLGLYAFLRLRAPSQQPSSLGHQASWLLLAVLAYGLGLLSKEMAVTLPLVMLSYDYIYELRLQEMRWGWADVRALGRGIARTVWSHKYLYLPLLLGGVGFSWHAAFVALPVWRVGWYGGSIVTNFLTTARIWVYYLYLLLWPMPLLADYTGAFPIVHSLLDPWAWGAVGFLLVLFLVTLGLMRSARLVAFSGLWFALTLLPVSHIIPYPEMLAEHYLYLPSFGFCFIVALLLARLAQSPQSEKEGQASSLKSQASSLWKPIVGYSLVVALVAFYAERTVIRNRDWRDDLTFYNRVVRDNPYSPRARLGLGYALDRSGFPRMAIIQYKAGLRLDPQDPRLYTNLGAAHQKLGELRAAEEVYKAALKLRAPDSKILINLGFLYIEKGEFDKARSALEKAERLSKGRDSAVYANFGLLYEVQNKLPEALAAYQKARTLEPKNEVYAQKITALEENLAKQGQGAGDEVEKGQLGSPQGALTR